eukprot:1538840-Prymnesium_polylepis.1
MLNAHLQPKNSLPPSAPAPAPSAADALQKEDSQEWLASNVGENWGAVSKCVPALRAGAAPHCRVALPRRRGVAHAFTHGALWRTTHGALYRLDALFLCPQTQAAGDDGGAGDVVRLRRRRSECSLRRLQPPIRTSPRRARRPPDSRLDSERPRRASLETARAAAGRRPSTTPVYAMGSDDKAAHDSARPTSDLQADEGIQQMPSELVSVSDDDDAPEGDAPATAAAPPRDGLAVGDGDKATVLSIAEPATGACGEGTLKTTVMIGDGAVSFSYLFADGSRLGSAQTLRLS